MADLFKSDLLDLSGGAVEGLSSSLLAPNQAALLRNFLLRDGKLRRRGGVAYFSQESFPSPLTSISSYTPAGLASYVLGHSTGLARMTAAGVISPASYTGADSIGFSLLPWFHKQYLDIMYSARAGAGGIKRITTSAFSDAGIAEPSSAPHIQNSSFAGSITGGNYTGFATFYNTLTGAESPRSPLSNNVTALGSQKIAWSLIPTSTNPQVNARRLWRTIVNQTGEYLKVVTIEDNTTTDYEDDVTTDNLGEIWENIPGPLPTLIEAIEIWEERLWATDGVDVYFSDLGRMEVFPADNLVAVYPDDGFRVRALHTWTLGNRGDRLVIGKVRGIYYLSGGGSPSSFSLNTLSTRVGCHAGHSMKASDGLLFFYGGDDIYVSDGGDPIPIGTPAIRATLDAIPPEDRAYLVGEVDPKEGWYILVIPVGASQTGKVLVYDYRRRAWFPQTHPINMTFLTRLHDQYNTIRYLATFVGQGHVFTWNEGVTDFGAPIEARYISPELSFGRYHGLRKAINRAHLRVDSVSENLTLEAYKDGALTPFKSRQVSLNTPHDWKRFAFSTQRDRRTALQFGLRYTGSAAIEIEAMALEMTAYRQAEKVA